MSVKNSLDELAVFGGAPLFKKKLYVGCPNIADRKSFLEKINSILDNKWLTNNGPYVQEFENRVRDIIGVKHCIATCNGTIALEIAIRALGLSGEVIVPSMTFIATAHALEWQGIRPVFCDINRETCNIDINKIEELITTRTTGILGVHLWGKPSDIKGLSKIADTRKLKLLFDASHAFGCTYRGSAIGKFGDAEVFSFHATKFVNTLEGGAVVTDSDELAQKVRLMKNFGFCGYDNVIYIGTNGKMNEISAAMGLTSLDSLDEFVSKNRQNYYAYREGLSGIPGLRLISYDEKERCNYQYIVIFIDESEAGINRDRIMEVLWGENILARRYFYPGCHRMEPYRSNKKDDLQKLPVTEEVNATAMQLPTGTSVGIDDITKICQMIGFTISNGSKISARAR